MNQPLSAGLVVVTISFLAIFGPLLGVPAAWIALMAGGGLVALTLDAARFGGRGGHLLAEALPGGEARLRRIAVHEAGQVLVGSLACWRSGVAAGGSTQLEPPLQAKLPLVELRRWSRVLQAGMAAEQLVYGECLGGSDDRALLGRLWGLSGHDAATAQREQRQARREVDQLLRQQREQLERQAEVLLTSAPRLLRPGSPTEAPDSP
jgi:hypothetical protein